MATIKLNEWSIHPAGSTDPTLYALPETGSRVFVRGTSDDGHQITTDELLRGEALRIWTKGNSEYVLGDMSSGYAEWVARQGEALQFMMVLSGGPFVSA